MKNFVERLKFSTLFDWEDFKHIGFEESESKDKFVERLELSTLYDWRDFEYIGSEKIVPINEHETLRKIG